MKDGCPVLNELAVTEDYDPEHENAPVLSGGDYDIGAIRSCADACLMGAYAWQRQERIWGIAAILGLSSGDTSEIEDTIRATIRSRDEWLEQATKNAARIEELVGRLRKLRDNATAFTSAIEAENPWTGLDLAEWWSEAMNDLDLP